MKHSGKIGWASAVLLMMTAAATLVHSHCQIPCGIYDDPVRIRLLAEHIVTIEKSMNQIQELSEAESTADKNQLVRWIMNKEQHADEFSEIVTYYFMAQRVSPVSSSDKEAHAKYIRQITLLHEMLVTAMKCKQTADLEHPKKLRSLLHDFEHAYLETGEHTH